MSERRTGRFLETGCRLVPRQGQEVQVCQGRNSCHLWGHKDWGSKGQGEQGGWKTRFPGRVHEAMVKQGLLQGVQEGTLRNPSGPGVSGEACLGRRRRSCPRVGGTGP